MNTPTPETNNEFDRLRFQVEPMSEFGITQRDEVVFGMRDFARKLERERDAWKAEAKKWETLYDELQDPLLLEVGRDSYGETEEYPDCIKRIITERDQLRKVCDELVKIPRGYPRLLWDAEAEAALDAYNQLPHVKK